MVAKFNPTQMRERLLGVIKERGLSLREVSLGSGSSESYLSGVLNRGRDPQLAKLIAVCDFLGVSTTWVLYGFEIPDGADDIFQLLSEKPELTSSVASLLRGHSSS